LLSSFLARHDQYFDPFCRLYNNKTRSARYSNKKNIGKELMIAATTELDQSVKPLCDLSGNLFMQKFDSEIL
jgi:hypothetical protein